MWKIFNPSHQYEVVSRIYSPPYSGRSIDVCGEDECEFYHHINVQALGLTTIILRCTCGCGDVKQMEGYGQEVAL